MMKAIHSRQRETAVPAWAFLLFSVLPVVLELWDRYQWKQRRKQVEKAEQANYRLWGVQD